MTFAVEGWPDLLGVVAHGGLAVEAIREGECWDIILDLDAAPEAVLGGLTCTLCGDGRAWPSLDALWGITSGSRLRRGWPNSLGRPASRGAAPPVTRPGRA